MTTAKQSETCGICDHHGIVTPADPAMGTWHCGDDGEACCADDGRWGLCTSCAAARKATHCADCGVDVETYGCAPGKCIAPLVCAECGEDVDTHIDPELVGCIQFAACRQRRAAGSARYVHRSALR